jgi:uncharacterized protein YcbK (DUF882 family)
LRLLAARLVSKSGLVLLFIVALISLGTPSAHALKLLIHKKHSKSHTSANAILDVPMPDEGYLLSADDPFLDEVPYLFPEGEQYSLKFVRGHTGETLDVVYRQGDFYIPDALDDIDYFLRDNHSEEVSECDPRLMDLLHTVLARVGKPDGEINILSGYRSQETNDMLRESHRTNAAEFSQHLYGMAIDIRITGIPAIRLRNAALTLKGGGVGYYPRGQFLHVDVGPVRHWTFVPHRARKHKKKTKTKKQ